MFVDKTTLIERKKDKSALIYLNVNLLHLVYFNFTKRIKLYIANDGNLIYHIPTEYIDDNNFFKKDKL